MKKVLIGFMLFCVALAANVPAAQAQQKTRVAVFPFEVTGSAVNDTEAMIIREDFTNRLAQTMLFDIVPRTDVDKLFRQEAAFQLNNLSDSAKTAEYGRVLNADWIIAGRLAKAGSRLALVVSMYTYPDFLQKPGSQVYAMNVDALIDGIPTLIADIQRVHGGGIATIPAPTSTTPAVPAPGTPAVTPTPASPGTGASTGVGQAAAGGQTQAGLYVGAAFQGAMDLMDALDWLTLNAQSGGKYTIALGKDEAITPTELFYGGKSVTVTLKADRDQHTITFAGKDPSYSLFTVGAGVTFTLENGVTFKGSQNNAAKSLVEVAGGKFIMNGGDIRKNTLSIDWDRDGAGVFVESGSFIMNDGSINGNSANGGPYCDGGGVHVSGIFTMNGGAISGNKTGSGGGGVYVKGTFTMNKELSVGTPLQAKVVGCTLTVHSPCLAATSLGIALAGPAAVCMPAHSS
jgi:TolB-like protein